jgi:hypothetical protein
MENIIRANAPLSRTDRIEEGDVILLTPIKPQL